MNEIIVTLFRRFGADWTKALRKATPSTRKASEASAHSAPRSFFLASMSVSTRDTDELMIPQSSFRRTGSPIFKRSVVSASDVDTWPPFIWHSAVNNCCSKNRWPSAFYHLLFYFVFDDLMICLQMIEFSLIDRRWEEFVKAPRESNWWRNIHRFPLFIVNDCEWLTSDSAFVTWPWRYFHQTNIFTRRNCDAVQRNRGWNYYK